MSTIAHTTGRDIAKRFVLALMVASATLGATPPPAPAAPPGAYVLVPSAPDPTKMGYYMMQGSRIVSSAYPSAPACFKAVAALMKTLPANVAPIVCAHRVP
ncbi:MAG TPA: hypothetical protein VGP41_14905 [Candidatus Lustribacter sp.]|nr:hypothetical protein [Candidatus Lustribacter sp.]